MGFSYAGEDRNRVAPVAEALARRFGPARVLFDKFHEAEFARPDLDVYLPRLYRDATELIVVVLSPDYPHKRWCGLEWRWIRQLILNAEPGRIMLLSLGNPGDLSELGILQGDGTLNVAGLPPETISARIVERLAQQGVRSPEEAPEAGAAMGLLAQPPAPPPPWWRSRRRGLALLAVLSLPLAWWLGRPPLASWQLRQGDQAFRAYAELSDEQWLKAAGAAWRRASQLNPGLAAAHGRLGFFADYLGDLPAAQHRWELALQREKPGTPAFKSYRTGLAHVLAQQPAQREKAMAIYGDVTHPRSAIELAMWRWPSPADLPQALDTLLNPDLTEALAGQGGEAEAPWGFKLPEGKILLVLNHREQRCLLAAVRETTAHLAAASPTATTPPLATADCQGLATDVRKLLCHRLEQARTNPRAAATGGWLGCTLPNSAPRERGDGHGANPSV